MPEFSQSVDCDDTGLQPSNESRMAALSVHKPELFVNLDTTTSSLQPLIEPQSADLTTQLPHWQQCHHSDTHNTEGFNNMFKYESLGSLSSIEAQGLLQEQQEPISKVCGKLDDTDVHVEGGTMLNECVDDICSSKKASNMNTSDSGNSSTSHFSSESLSDIKAKKLLNNDVSNAGLKNSRSLSSSPWPARNQKPEYANMEMDSSNELGRQKQQQHNSMSSLTRHLLPNQQQRDANPSIPNSTADRTETEPGDSGVFIDLSKSHQ